MRRKGVRGIVKIILITGHGENVGAKTITSGLVSALRTQGISALALDLCPSNLLRLHFGMDPENEDGLARSIIDRRPFESANYRSREGIDFLPFGKISHDEYRQLIDWTLRNPGWLKQWAMRLDLPSDSFLICHAPATSHELWQDILDSAWQLKIFVLDALTLLRMEQAARNDSRSSDTKKKWIINGFDTNRILDRDAELVVRAHFKERIAPVTLHRDEHHREALAQYITIHAYAPSSQGAHDMTKLALWLIHNIEADHLL